MYKICVYICGYIIKVPSMNRAKCLPPSLNMRFIFSPFLEKKKKEKKKHLGSEYET